MNKVLIFPSRKFATLICLAATITCLRAIEPIQKFYEQLTGAIEGYCAQADHLILLFSR